MRDTEQLARRVATERARKGDLTPELLLLERELTEKLGTRVRIEKKDNGGKVLIDFFSVEDLAHIRDMVSQMRRRISGSAQLPAPPSEPQIEERCRAVENPTRTQSDDLYSISNFSV